MNLFKKALKAFHNTETFKKHGFRQVSTWVGIFIFICVFDKEFHVLVSNVLSDVSLAGKVATALSGLILMWFNKLEKK